MVIRILYITLLLLMRLPAFGQVPGQAELLEKAVAENEFAGVAAGFSIAGDSIWTNGAGYSDVENKEAFTGQTLTQIASLVKPMTAIAVMQLWEQGKVKLDDPIQEYVPDFPVKKEGPVTVRQLLNHSSGIGGYASEAARENRKNYTTLAEAVAVFKDSDLVSPPGTAYYYSTYGYVLLGRLIENVSGTTYEAYMKQHIWEKAGMHNTGVTHSGTVYPGKSLSYHKSRNGAIGKAAAINLSDRVPGGGVYSCVADILKFGDALLNNLLISENTLRIMLTDPGIKEKGNGYGLGWTLYSQNPEYGAVFGHTGSQTGVSARLTLLPEKKITVVVLSNTSGSMKQVSALAEQLAAIAAAVRK